MDDLYQCIVTVRHFNHVNMYQINFLTTIRILFASISNGYRFFGSSQIRVQCYVQNLE